MLLRLNKLIYLFVFIGMLGLQTSSSALETVSISEDMVALELSHAIKILKGEKGRIEIQTVADSDGVVRRLEITSKSQAGVSDWAIFALKNNTDKQIDRLIVAPHYKMAGSGIIWPDLGSNRILDITPSEGFPPDRQPDQNADIFIVTLDPGSITTFAAELHGSGKAGQNMLPQLQLWEPNAYKDYVNRFTLFHGIVIGISGLLALVLSILFVVKGGWMFPAISALAWAVLIYLCIDFGFFQQIFKPDPIEKQFYRGLSEVALATCLFLFLFAYLRLNRWHTRFLQLGIFCSTIFLIIFGTLFIWPNVASGLARISMAFTGILGLILISLLAYNRYHRAIMLIPSWILYCGWLALSWITLTDKIVNDLGSSALTGGLMLILLLFGFTVLQHAFSSDSAISGLLSDVERRALAFTGGGDLLWDWDVPHDKLYTSTNSQTSHKMHGHIADNGSLSHWLMRIHPEDQDALRKSLEAILEVGRGRISQDCRMVDQSENIRSFKINARPILNSDNQVIRVIGKMEEITDTSNAIERYLHDAVHDNLTNLPNRQLFLDRLDSSLKRAKVEKTGYPVIYLVNIDRFSEVNESVGSALGDHILIAAADRMKRALQPHDSIARVNGDQFAIMAISRKTSQEVAGLAAAIKQFFATPFNIDDKDLFLTCSIGIVAYDPEKPAEDYLKDADLAVLHAKKSGGDRIEAFRHTFRAFTVDYLTLVSDLRRAITNNELVVFYQPIHNAKNQEIVGFESLLRWEHPVRGRMMPDEFIPITERSGLIADLGDYVISKVANQIEQWSKAGLFDSDMFVSVNISSRQILQQNFLSLLKQTLKRYEINAGNIVLELTESLVMENPEKAGHILSKIQEMGMPIALDDFGAGYSSLAYVQHLPLTYIKSDKQFLKDHGSGANLAILRAISVMAHELGIKMIAEGVETENDLVNILQIECDYAQGYFFDKPMKVQEASKLLKSIAKSGIHPSEPSSEV